jgi:hypothetical protein
MMLFFVGMYFVPKFITATAGFFRILTAVPWPWLNLFLGVRETDRSPFQSVFLPAGSRPD